MIYFITARDLHRVKIGFSSNPQQRFSKAQTDSPVQLALERVCDGDEAEEKRLHTLFGAHRIAGEWFTLSDEIEAYMAKIPAVPKKEKSIAQLIISATGISKGHVSQMLSDKYPHKVSIPVAISVYRHSGHLIGPIKGASEAEIDTLEKFCGRYSPARSSAPAETRVIVCDVCERQFGGGIPNACTFVDCPHSGHPMLGESA